MLLRILSYNAYLGIVQSIKFGVGTPQLGEGRSDVTDVRISAYERHHLGARTTESTDSRPLSFLLSRLLTHSSHTDILVLSRFWWDFPHSGSKSVDR